MWSIFTILLAATASSALALPPQTILVDDDLVEITMPFRYDINASWTTTCPDGQTVSCPHDEEETCCDNIKNNDSKWIIGDVPCPTPNPCLPSQSCCRTKTDYIGCCPYKNGVCCLGGSLCCPGGMRCNLKEMICEYKDDKGSIGIYPVTPLEESKITCPDRSICEDKMTCCKLFDGQYGCCPFENASCCSDGKHCCPRGLKCDVEQGRCIKDIATPLAPIIIADDEDVKSNICPDPAVKCAPSQTCCQLADGSFGCCPFKDAVCCKDGQHCCPSGMQCDVKHGRCLRNQDYKFWQFFEPYLDSDIVKSLVDNNQLAKPVKTTLVKSTNICPNPEDQCLEGQTCCKISPDDYGCCPFKNAVCCSDMLHCCPQNMIVHDDDPDPPPGILLSCPDNWVDCQDSCCQPENTCCNGKCCPLEEATCCDDQVHCCPGNMVCDTSNDQTPNCVLPNSANDTTIPN